MHLLERLVGALLMGAVGLTFANVSRRALGFGVFPFADELARRMLVALTFVGAALAVVRASHLRIDALLEAAPPRLTRWMKLLVTTLSIVFFALLIIEGWSFAQSTMSRSTPTMNVSVAWTTGIVPIGGMLMLMSFVGRLRYGPSRPLLGDGMDDDAAVPKDIDGPPQGER